MKRFIHRLRHVGIVMSVGLAAGGLAMAQSLPGVDSLDRGEGKRVAGSFLGNANSGFRFVPKDGAAAIPIKGLDEIHIGGTGPGPTAGVPPVEVVLGLGQSISGQLISLDEKTIELGEGPSGKPVSIARHGALSLRQRPGEVLVLSDGFESLDSRRWTHVGEPKIEATPHVAGEKSLRLQADGSAITTRLPEAVSQGRLELAFYDTAENSPGAQWFVDLLFRGDRGQETVRAVLGWSEDSLAVQTTGNIAFAVQRLARKPGWHRLEVRFDAESAAMSVDGNALANGKGPTGPLIEIRLGTSLTGKPGSAGLAAHIDDLRLVRLASVVTALEADPDQDEVRLIEGDQVFGAIQSADARQILLSVIGKPLTLLWSDVSSLQFRRVPKPSREISGLFATLEWRSAPGNDPRDSDRAEGVLTMADPSVFILETAYAGRLVVPRDRVRRLVVEHQCRRLVIDPFAHHLGDEVNAKAPDLLDPPQPEGGVLERSFVLSIAPEPQEKANLVMDVVQVVGEANGLDYSQFIRDGELRTKVSLNGREFDYLNRHIKTRNETPERIRLPIPAGLLKAGENRIKIVQTGKAKDPKYFDDLGILGIAIEISAESSP